MRVAQGALDEWVAYYNTERPHRSLEMATPANRFAARDWQGRALTRDR